MPINPTFDSSKLKQLRAALNEIDTNLTKEMNRAIKGPAAAAAKRLKGTTPQPPILSGMGHQGRTGIGKIQATGYGPSRKSLARIELFSKPQAAGFKIADLAGTRNQLSNTNRGYTRRGPSGDVVVKSHPTSSGRALIDALDKVDPLLGRGGRFGWREFIAQRPALVRDVVEIIDKFCAKTQKDVTR